MGRGRHIALPELCGQEPLEREFSLLHFNPLWPHKTYPRAARCAYDKEYKYYWDGRFYHYAEDPLEEHPLDIADCTPEVQALHARLKARVDELPGWYPDKPGRRATATTRVSTTPNRSNDTKGPAYWPDFSSGAYSCKT